MKLLFDTKYAEHKSAGCQFFSVYDFFNCLFECLNALATLVCSGGQCSDHCLCRFLGEVHISQNKAETVNTFAALFSAETS